MVKMEHCGSMYRLYSYDSCKGVFRGENQQMVLESIPKEFETYFTGLLLFNELDYNKAFKNWKNYWDWTKKRNPHRYVSQERGEIDYDCKNILHCMRLLFSGRNILKGHGPKVRFDGDELKLLMDIRQGVYTYDKVMCLVNEQMELMNELKETTSLPFKVNQQEIDLFYRELTAEVVNEYSVEL